jgi:hypothetical protein
MSAARSAPFLLPLPLDRVTALALDAGARVEVHGHVATVVDGLHFDAMGLFDFGAGGLRVVGHDAARSAYVLEATGETAIGCSAAGVASPCLLPKLAEIAHERLLTARELAATLSGGIELEAGGDAPPATASKLTIAGLCVAGALTIAWLAVAWSRRLARTALGRVRAAARQALRATEGDATLEPVRKEIRVLVDRAVGLDSVELERVESVLRVVTLRAETRRGLSRLSDPVEALVAELDLRDQAMAEVDAR